MYIAQATADILRQNDERFSLVFASHLVAAPAASEARITIDDAKIIGQALVEVLLATMTRFPFPPLGDVAPRLHEMASGLAPRAAIDRAFVAACQDIFPAPGRGMTVNAWRELLTWFLTATPPADRRDA
ncbi:hypothetical protein [Sphingomonas solaris]|uniref:Globin n=1 Tax=Alterirhizorhabdus solaris TaxID=2529389 RepID=A0A558QV44_9SPHN|nr:hypothetical protein [Sphingomonas solaris]TVV71023.1 hypothetical protein FOY91_17735 [Sphingomonas solaris]